MTLVHADRIRGVTCEVKGDTATGTVSYEVPKLYRGKFNYVAQRHRRRLADHRAFHAGPGDSRGPGQSWHMGAEVTG